MTRVDWNVVLWALQVVLALAFIVAGAGHAFDFDRASSRPRMGWMTSVGRDRMRIIGLLEVAGGIGLIVPALTGIAPWLTAVAAAGLALLMLAALLFHLARREYPASVVNALLGGLALVAAGGRVLVAPF
jgi:uncharacterized membrane protein YphA (DoxX/SURF4 family)